MDKRLLLLSHGSTAAMRAGRFPADDPLDERGLAEVAAAAERVHAALGGTAAVFVSPARSARQTAAALGMEVDATVESRLNDIDYAAWHGRRLADLAAEAPHDLAAWMRDPDCAAHGGESFSQLVKRVGQWLDAADLSAHGTDRATVGLVITHATVIRAALIHALGASPTVFARIDITPLSLVELRHSARGWVWRPAS
ncbi:broad specificity phosphatase PhoE [Paraburkholderia sp. GAS199]|uniref:histidine phosphatase family protein n=1 Tax=Paraburkholderia sp. GAS199 TaxID=3035126 RepID=UPI003D213066